MDIKISILNEFNKEVSTYITDLDSYELLKKHNISIQDKIDEMIHKIYFNQVSENNQTEDLVKIPNGDDFFLSEKEAETNTQIPKGDDFFKINGEPLEGAILKLTSKSDLQPYTVFFSNERKEMLKLCPNGDIFVHGRLADNDKQVVDALRDFLRSKSLI